MDIFSKSKACSVLYKDRPLRIAFLIDPQNTTDELLDRIIEFSIEKWGGRYFPIIPCDGTNITNSFWSLLEFSDPDIIYSFVNLDDSLLEKIDHSISPFNLYVKVLEKNHHNYFHDTYLGHPLPNEFLIKKIPELFQTPFFLVKSKLCVFRMNNDSENYSFLLRNFGYLKYLLQFYTKGRDPKLIIELNENYKEIDSYEVDVDKGPKEILNLLSDTRNLIYPILLSEFPGSLAPLDYDDRDRGFLIGIGDSILTYLYLWNRIHLLGGNPQRSLSHLVIPDKYLQDELFIESIKKIIKSSIYSDSGGRYNLRLVSATKTNAELTEFAEYFKKGKDAFYWAIDICCSSDNFNFPVIKNIKSTPLRYKESGNIESFDDRVALIPNKGPIPIKDSSNIQAYGWMIDIDITYRPELFSYTNVEYWWKLPRRSGITYLFNKIPSRINKHGSISFLIDSNEQYFKITVPDDMAVFFQLISPYYNYAYKSDARKKKDIEFKDITLSDKGRYLNGTLGLFPSLWHAYRCFGENFWRNTFRYMSSIKDKKEENQLIQLKGKVIKALKIACDNFMKNKEQTVEYLTSYLYTLIREEKYERTMDFGQFFNMAKKERESFLDKTEDKHGFEYTDEDLKIDLEDALQNLLDSNILFQGIRPKCRHCGFRNWFDLNEVKKDLICKGCHTQFKFPVEIKWFYKQNELIKRTILYQGVMATLMCLGHLLEESRESFIFIPNICLFKNRDDQDPAAELDIICISDGTFIIGEVKNSAKLFSPSDFSKIEETALKIRPDKIVIYAFEGPYDNAIKLTDELKVKMIPHDIDVVFIEPWDYIHKPSYHL